MVNRVWKLILALMAMTSLFATDPTFLRRRVAGIQPGPDDLTANARSVTYRAIFGIGDPDAAQLKGIARYGELTVGPEGTSAVVSYPAEEQIYFILDGNGILLYGDERVPVKRNDYMYLPPRMKHGIANSSSRPVRLLVMGFRVPDGRRVPPTPKLMLANADDVELQILGAHGPKAQFKLLMGTTESKRDRLAAASVMVSLFIMDFEAGGTNIPHHHDRQEEIYYLLRGHGDMVAGGGADGNEGRHPAKEGEAFFFRLNATVGFYSGSSEGEPHALILAVRSEYPFDSPRP